MSASNHHDRFKARDSSSYDEVSDTFDRLTQRFSTPMAESLIESVALAEGDRVLDVGTGTGILARFAAARVGRGSVTGIDLSSGMLEIAERRAREAGLSIRFHRMDAESLDFESDMLDAAVSLYTLRHLPDPEGAVAEMFRVLRPGGRIAVGVGSAPGLLTQEGVRAACRRLAEFVRRLANRGDYQACAFLERFLAGRLPRREPETAEWEHHHSEFSGSVASMLRAAGFESITTRWVGQESVIDTPETFWELQVTFSSVARKRIAGGDPGQVAALKREFLEQCRAHQRRGGRLVYATGATIVGAVKPDVDGTVSPGRVDQG